MRLLQTLVTLIALLLMIACSGKKKPEPQTMTVDTTQVLHAPPSKPTTQGQETTEMAAESAQTGVSESILGTWSFALGEKQMVVTYKSDGTFESESTMGNSRLELDGTYELNGNRLVSRPTAFSASDTTDAKAADIVNQLNQRIKQDPKAVIERVTIKFEGNGKFTATYPQGNSITFTRMK